MAGIGGANDNLPGPQPSGHEHTQPDGDDRQIKDRAAQWPTPGSRRGRHDWAAPQARMP